MATPASYGGVAVPGDFFFLRLGCYETGNPKALDGNQESPRHPPNVTPCRGRNTPKRLELASIGRHPVQDLIAIKLCRRMA